MIPMKLLGAAGICAASFWTGLSASRRMKAMDALLSALSCALERMDCELSCTLIPFRTICERLRSEPGPVGVYFGELCTLPSGPDEAMETIERSAAARAGLRLPEQSAQSLHRLIAGFGRYDLERQRRLLELTKRQVRSDTELLRQTLAGKCRCYEMLGLCTGAAVTSLAL